MGPHSEGRPEVRILGPVELSGPGGRTVELQLQCRKVLVLLTIAGGTALTTERIVNRVWGPEPPRRAAQMVRSHVRVLRGALGREGAPILTRDSRGYRLDPAECDVDAERFRSLLREGRVRRRATDVDGAARVLNAALERWRGTEAMPDVRDIVDLKAEAVHLEELRNQTEGLLIECLLLSGREDEALPRLRALTERHPTRERFWLQLMVAQTLSGRRLDAAGATFWRARRHLVEETGLEVRSLDVVQRAILDGADDEVLVRLVTRRDSEVA